MRVISQDGTIDIPYEDVIIQRYLELWKKMIFYIWIHHMN